MTQSDQTPKTHKTRPWLRIVLFTSLALNLLIVGAVVGRLATGGPDRRVPRADRMGAPLTFALNEEDRRAIGHALKQKYGKDRPSRRQIEAEYRGVIAALRAQPFDASQVEAALTRQQKIGAERVALGQRLLMDRVLEMSVAERALFADRLEEGLKRQKYKRPPRLKDRD